MKTSILAGLGLVFLNVISSAAEYAPQKGVFLQLQFSLDGSYLLAQDDSEIAILTVRPFAVLFRIPANRARSAEFTPDSGQIVFVSSDPPSDREKNAIRMYSPDHVERWDIARQIRVESPPLPFFDCGSEALSPDGRILVCVDRGGTLHAVNVTTGQTVFEKKKFARLFANYNATGLPGSYSGELASALIDFSLDARFVVAKPEGADGPAVALNLRDPGSIPLVGELAQLRNTRSWFAWIGPDRILEAHGEPSSSKSKVRRAQIVSFPSGTTLSETAIPWGKFYRAADPHFVITRPFGGKPIIVHEGGQVLIVSDSDRAAATELATGQVIISQTHALDVFGRYYVAEPNDGEVGLYEIGKGLRASVTLRRK